MLIEQDSFFFLKKKNQKSNKKRYENPRHIYFDQTEMKREREKKIDKNKEASQMFMEPVMKEIPQKVERNKKEREKKKIDCRADFWRIYQ